MADFIFALQTDLTPIRETKLIANFDEAEKAINEMLAPYVGLVVEADAISEAKDIKARINKVKASIDENRKGVKAIYTEPLKAYEERCKKLTAICDSAYANIDTQVKAFDEKRRAEKLEAARLFFTEAVASFDPDGMYLRWESVVDPRFGNASMSEQSIHEAINAAIQKCQTEIGAIKALGSKNENLLLFNYSKSHDLPAVLNLNAELIRREQEAERRKAEEAAKAEQVAVEVPSEKVAAAEEMETAAPEESLVTMVFKVSCTRSQLSALGAYMKANGIRYGRA